MESSQYNYFIQLDGNILVFNGFTKKYFVIRAKKADKFKEVINNPELFRSDSRYLPFLEKMSEAGFIVDSRNTQYEEIKNAYKDYQMEDKYILLIMPTYSCNFSCWYCVQKHQDVFMSDSTADKIKKHIVRYITENNIKSLYISWFGGEPLLYFDRIRQITAFAREFCQKQKINFGVGITTNSSLINDDIVDEMRNLSFKGFQITVDGASPYHNMTKKSSSIFNSFDLTLNNIVKVVRNIPDADMTVRINYTEYNITKDFVIELDHYLSPVKDKITIMFRKVWQVKENSTMHDKVLDCIKELLKRGYRIECDYDNFQVQTCYVEKKNYLSIFPDGKVDTCSNINISDARGEIEEDGRISWKSPVLATHDNIFEKASECKDCTFLPLCMGPCPLQREKRKGVKVIRCYKQNLPDEFHQKILDYCNMLTELDY